jgi:glycine cleavage system aminomethyltransferase T
MYLKANISGSRKGLSGDACLTLGRRIANVECGLAHAARAIQTGNAAGLVQGLEVAARFSKEVEDLLPQAASEARAIKTAAETIDRDLRKKKKVSGEEAGKVLARLRGLAKKLEALHAGARKHCGGAE